MPSRLFVARAALARASLLILAALTAALCTAQTPATARAILLDGAGPWRDANWTLGVTEFTSLLTDAGVVLGTSMGDLPLQNPVAYLQRTDWAPLQVTAGQSRIDITGRLNIQGTGSFGETLRLSLLNK